MINIIVSQFKSLEDNPYRPAITKFIFTFCIVANFLGVKSSIWAKLCINNRCGNESENFKSSGFEMVGFSISAVCKNLKQQHE